MLAHTLSRASPSTTLKEIGLFTDFAPIGHISPLGTSPLPRLQSSFHPFAAGGLRAPVELR
jgi:hypothetical protein